METNMISRESLERAARAFVGDNGVNIIVELARLLDEAEARGRAATSDVWANAYKQGYEDCKANTPWVDWPEVDEADLRAPIDNAVEEGAVWRDYTELHVDAPLSAVDQSWVDAAQAENRSLMSDAEAYEALDRLYTDAMDAEVRGG